MKITDKIRSEIIKLRDEGLSYGKIAKATGASRSSVIKVVQDHQIKNEPVTARVRKTFPNPRIVEIFFNENQSDFAKCVVRAEIQYRFGQPLKVKRVELSNERLYRLA